MKRLLPMARMLTALCFWEPQNIPTSVLFLAVLGRRAPHLDSARFEPFGNTFLEWLTSSRVHWLGRRYQIPRRGCRVLLDATSRFPPQLFLVCSFHIANLTSLQVPVIGPLLRCFRAFVHTRRARQWLLANTMFWPRVHWNARNGG